MNASIMRETTVACQSTVGRVFGTFLCAPVYIQTGLRGSSLLISPISSHEHYSLCTKHS